MKNKILLIPGWACAKDVWHENFVNEFSDYEIISASWTDFLDDETSSNFLSINNLHKEKDLIIIGWSLGGIQTMNLYKKLENNIKAIVLLSSTACLGEREKYFGVPVKFLDIMKKQIIEKRSKQVMQFFINFLSPDKNMEMLNDFTAKSEQFSNDELYKGLVYLQESDLRDNITKIKVPVLIIHGMEDKIVPFKQAEYLKDNISNSRLHLIESSGHNLAGKIPEKAASLIRRFINGGE